MVGPPCSVFLRSQAERGNEVKKHTTTGKVAVFVTLFGRNTSRQKTSVQIERSVKNYIVVPDKLFFSVGFRIWVNDSVERWLSRRGLEVDFVAQSHSKALPQPQNGRKNHPSPQRPQIVPRRGQQRVDFVARLAGQVIATEPFVTFEVTNGRLHRGAAF